MTKKKLNPKPKGHVGNKHAVKLRTPEIKAEAYRQYCDWISKGNSKEAWTFDHEKISLTSKTMEKYIRESPSEFPSIHKERAESLSYSHWETLGKKMMLGEIKGGQPAIYQMFMRNKFGWDTQTRTSISFEPEAKRLLEKFESED